MVMCRNPVEESPLGMRGSKETAEQTRYWKHKACAGSVVFFCKSQIILDTYKK